MREKTLSLPGEDSTARGWAGVRRALPYVLFAALMAAGWRAWDIVHAVPFYEDVLEATWAVKWYDAAVRGLHGGQVYPLAFYPVGWHMATFADGPAMFLLLLPLYWLGGAAFAYNVAAWLTFLIAFIGARKLALRLVGPFAATVVALLFAFWGFRWYALVGHLNILLPSALLPWLVLAVQNALAVPAGPAGARPGLIRLAVAGALWALMIACSWYFVWLGGVLLAGWLAGLALGRRISWRAAGLALAVPAAVGAGLTLPLLLWFLQATRAAHASFYDLSQITLWDASLNALVAPSVSHPWLAPLAGRLYSGPTNEPGQANFGLLAPVLALVGVALARRDGRWRPALAVAVLGVALALGVALHWNGQAVQWDAMRPLDAALWRLGHWLKPAVFTGEAAPEPFAAMVPMPGALLSALVPWWEQARVFARYVLLASLGVFLLAGLALDHLRRAWARVLLAALLLVEALPAPTGNQPFPPPAHPAFAALAGQQLPPGQAILDLGSWQPGLLFMPIGGETLWATSYHGQPTVAGASSVWPAHVAFLDRWLATHPHPFQDPEFVPLLRFYHVSTILFHNNGGASQAMLEEARQNLDVLPVQCYDPAPGPGPWDYPLCLIRLAPGPALFNVLWREGWSGAEPWGRWIEGIGATVDWVATTEVDQRVTIEVFPQCTAGRQQSLALTANGFEVARHRWTGCEPWAAQVTVPASAVRIGWNHLALQAGYAANGGPGDTRELSVGVARLRIEAAP